MKKNYLFKLITLVLLFYVPTNKVHAQTAGDIAIIAYNGDGANSIRTGDYFAFVMLIDFPANTPIWFTDNIWDGDSFTNLNDGEIKWQHTDVVPAGTVIIISGITNIASTVKIDSGPGSITFDKISFGTSVETLFALLSEPSTSTMASPGFLTGFSIDFDGETNTLNGTGLTSGTNFIDFDNSYDGLKYIGSKSSETSYTNYLPLIMNTANWQQEQGLGYQILPIEATSFTISGTTTWNGTTNDWNTATNWNNGLPTKDMIANIPSTANNPTINNNVVAGNVEIETGVTLNITTGNTLDTKGTIAVGSQSSFKADTGSTVTAGAIVVQSGSTAIINNAYSSRLIQYRNIPTATDWYLVSNPTTDQRPKDFTYSNKIRTSGSNLAFSWYLSDGSAWNYLPNGTTNIATFDVGKGYSISRTSVGDLSFDGTMATGQIDIAVSEGSANAFNLIGNPYAAYIPLNTATDATNDILSNNSGVLSEQTIWVWDSQENSGAGKYITLNQTSGTRYIAPGQGFFVSSSNSGGNFTFTTAMQSHQTTEVFNRSGTLRPEIKISVKNGDTFSSSDIFYINGTTKGFDNGYDSSIFGGSTLNFSIYTSLVMNSSGEKLAIQSLPDSNYESTIVPVGIISEAGTVTFSLSSVNFPDGINVYLEDREENTFTNFSDENATYSTTFTDAVNGIGRFYLHTSSSALSLENTESNLQNIHIYNSNNKTVTVTGLNQEKTSLRVYNLLGKQVFNSSFNGKNHTKISLPSLSAGMYLFQVETNYGRLNKKIILE